MASSSNSEFGWTLLKDLTKGRGAENVFLSPFSISVALAMTRLGAKGETATGMEKTLCWQTDGNKIHQEYQKYIKYLQTPVEGIILRTANRIYVEKGYTFLETFMNQTKELYLAEPISAQFQSNPDAERIQINTWVEEQTENKIKNLLSEGVIDNDTRMVLVNAIYFNGKWEYKFDAANTLSKEFYISPSQKKSVPMMTMERKLPYYKGKGFAVLEIPYKGDTKSMVIFLPDDRFGLEAFEQRLTIADIKQCFGHLRQCGKVQISFPRFEISSSFALKETLCSLGMSKAFDVNEADFTGMTGSKDLCISEVVHKAFLRVNEEGSEAAAATAVVMMLRCAMPMEPPIIFTADHPFFVVIRDKNSDMILFMGQVTNPEQPN